MEVQTDINKPSMNKIIKNHESVVFFKRLVFFSNIEQ